MIIIYIAVQRLDNKTRKEWELYIFNKELPTLQQLYMFLEHRCNALESLQNKTTMHEQRQESVRPNDNKSTSYNYNSVKQQCPLCNDSHVVFQCHKFKQLSNQERYKVVKDHRLCINCLSHEHMVRECKSSRCKTCGRWHHTLLHRDQDSLRYISCIERIRQTLCAASNSSSQG
jgi:hypothetical protein